MEVFPPDDPQPIEVGVGTTPQLERVKGWNDSFASFEMAVQAACKNKDEESENQICVSQSDRPDIASSEESPLKVEVKRKWMDDTIDSIGDDQHKTKRVNNMVLSSGELSIQLVGKTNENCDNLPISKILSIMTSEPKSESKDSIQDSCSKYIPSLTHSSIECFKVEPKTEIKEEIPIKNDPCIETTCTNVKSELGVTDQKNVQNVNVEPFDDNKVKNENHNLIIKHENDINSSNAENCSEKLCGLADSVRESKEHIQDGESRENQDVDVKKNIEPNCSTEGSENNIHENSPSVLDENHEKKKEKKEKKEETIDKSAKKDDKKKKKFERCNIRDIKLEDELDAVTLSAQKEEQERIRRLQEAQMRALQERLQQIEVEKEALTQLFSQPTDDVPNLFDSASVNESESSIDEKKPVIKSESSSIDLDVNSEDDKKKKLLKVQPARTEDTIIDISSSSSDESDSEDSDKKDDDIMVLSDEGEPEGEGPAEDPNNSGAHTNDLFNLPDEEGRVLVNVGHPPEDPDIFLAPQIAKVIKPHQIGGIRFLYDNVVENLERYKSSSGFGCILAHSMGLGKTVQVVSFVDVFLRHTPASLVLCIVPINTIQNWKAEFDMWVPSSSCVDDIQVLNGEVRPRDYQVFTLNENFKTMAARGGLIAEWRKDGGILLMGYEMYRMLALRKMPKIPLKKSKRLKKQEMNAEPETNEQIKKYMDEMYEHIVIPGPDLVICDEGHRIKNSLASTSMALKSIKTRRRVVLTGYPLQNNLLEYWCMVDFVRPNYLGSRAEFCNMFERPISNGQCIDSTPRDRQLMRFRSHVLHSLLVGFVQRRGHSVLRAVLPKKEEHVLLIRMTPIQRQLYKCFVKDLLYVQQATNPLKLFAVCCKIWNHPDILFKLLQEKKAQEDIDLDIDISIASSSNNQSTGCGMKKRAYQAKTKLMPKPLKALPRSLKPQPNLTSLDSMKIEALNSSNYTVSHKDENSAFDTADIKQVKKEDFILPTAGNVSLQNEFSQNTLQSQFQGQVSPQIGSNQKLNSQNYQMPSNQQFAQFNNQMSPQQYSNVSSIQQYGEKQNQYSQGYTHVNSQFAPHSNSQQASLSGPPSPSSKLNFKTNPEELSHNYSEQSEIKKQHSRTSNPKDSDFQSQNSNYSSQSPQQYPPVPTQSYNSSASQQYQKNSPLYQTPPHSYSEQHAFPQPPSNATPVTQVTSQQSYSQPQFEKSSNFLPPSFEQHSHSQFQASCYPQQSSTLPPEKNSQPNTFPPVSPSEQYGQISLPKQSSTVSQFSHSINHHQPINQVFNQPFSSEFPEPSSSQFSQQHFNQDNQTFSEQSQPYQVQNSPRAAFSQQEFSQPYNQVGQQVSPQFSQPNSGQATFSTTSHQYQQNLQYGNKHGQSSSFSQSSGGQNPSPTSPQEGKQQQRFDQIFSGQQTQDTRFSSETSTFSHSSTSVSQNHSQYSSPQIGQSSNQFLQLPNAPQYNSSTNLNQVFSQHSQFNQSPQVFNQQQPPSQFGKDTNQQTYSHQPASNSQQYSQQASPSQQYPSQPSKSPQYPQTTQNSLFTQVKSSQYSSSQAQKPYSQQGSQTQQLNPNISQYSQQTFPQQSGQQYSASMPPSPQQYAQQTTHSPQQFSQTQYHQSSQQFPQTNQSPQPFPIPGKSSQPVSQTDHAPHQHSHQSVTSPQLFAQQSNPMPQPSNNVSQFQQSSQDSSFSTKNDQALQFSSGPSQSSEPFHQSEDQGTSEQSIQKPLQFPQQSGQTSQQFPQQTNQTSQQFTQESGQSHQPFPQQPGQTQQYPQQATPSHQQFHQPGQSSLQFPPQPSQQFSPQPGQPPQQYPSQTSQTLQQFVPHASQTNQQFPQQASQTNRQFSPQVGQTPQPFSQQTEPVSQQYHHQANQSFTQPSSQCNQQFSQHQNKNVSHTPLSFQPSSNSQFDSEISSQDFSQQSNTTILQFNTEQPQVFNKQLNQNPSKVKPQSQEIQQFPHNPSAQIYNSSPVYQQPIQSSQQHGKSSATPSSQYGSDNEQFSQSSQGYGMKPLPGQQSVQQSQQNSQAMQQISQPPSPQHFQQSAPSPQQFQQQPTKSPQQYSQPQPPPLHHPNSNQFCHQPPSQQFVQQTTTSHQYSQPTPQTQQFLQSSKSPQHFPQEYSHQPLQSEQTSQYQMQQQGAANIQSQQFSTYQKSIGQDSQKECYSSEQIHSNILPQGPQLSPRSTLIKQEHTSSACQSMFSETSAQPLKQSSFSAQPFENGSSILANAQQNLKIESSANIFTPQNNVKNQSSNQESLEIYPIKSNSQIKTKEENDEKSSVSQLSNISAKQEKLESNQPCSAPDSAIMPTRDRTDSSISYEWAIPIMKDYVVGVLENSHKMMVLFVIISETLHVGDKLLVFSQSLSTLDLLEHFLNKIQVPRKLGQYADGLNETWCRNKNYFRLDGSTSAQEREKLINEFNRNDSVSLFLLSTRAGCLGINLVGANRIVVMDASWNPCHDAQAVCRIYRYGQKKQCHIYRLVTDNSLEKRIYDRQVNKQGMSDRVVDELNPESNFTWKDVTTLIQDDEDDNTVQELSKFESSYSDKVLKYLVSEMSPSLSKEPFQHESLLLDRKDLKLTKQEKRLAKQSYEMAKRANMINIRTTYTYLPSGTPGGGQFVVNNKQCQWVGGTTIRVLPNQGTSGGTARSGSTATPITASPTLMSSLFKQGVMVQKLTMPSNVSIPVLTPGAPPVVIPAGQDVLVLRTPKGVYLRLPDGRIIAVQLPPSLLAKTQFRPNVVTHFRPAAPKGNQSTVISTPRGQSIGIIKQTLQCGGTVRYLNPRNASSSSSQNSKSAAPEVIDLSDDDDEPSSQKKSNASNASSNSSESDSGDHEKFENMHSTILPGKQITIRKIPPSVHIGSNLKDKCEIPQVLSKNKQITIMPINPSTQHNRQKFAPQLAQPVRVQQMLLQPHQGKRKPIQKLSKLQMSPFLTGKNIRPQLTITPPSTLSNVQSLKTQQAGIHFPKNIKSSDLSNTTRVKSPAKQISDSSSALISEKKQMSATSFLESTNMSKILQNSKNISISLSDPSKRRSSLPDSLASIATKLNPNLQISPVPQPDNSSSGETISQKSHQSNTSSLSNTSPVVQPPISQSVHSLPMSPQIQSKSNITSSPMCDLNPSPFQQESSSVIQTSTSMHSLTSDLSLTAAAIPSPSSVNANQKQNEQKNSQYASQIHSSQSPKPLLPPSPLTPNVPQNEQAASRKRKPSAKQQAKKSEPPPSMTIPDHPILQTDSSQSFQHPQVADHHLPDNPFSNFSHHFTNSDFQNFPNFSSHKPLSQIQHPQPLHPLQHVPDHNLTSHLHHMSHLYPMSAHLTGSPASLTDMQPPAPRAWPIPQPAVSSFHPFSQSSSFFNSGHESSQFSFQPSFPLPQAPVTPSAAQLDLGINSGPGGDSQMN